MPIRPDQRGRYPANWREIAHEIKAVRAGGRCECVGECGSPRHFGDYGENRCCALHGLPHPETGSIVVLTVAHLDHQPEHNDPANLRAMCQLCHLAYDAEHHAETRRARRAADSEPTLFDTEVS